MCGIVAVCDVSVSAENIFQMLDSLRHRGPDDVAVWSDEETGTYLGHRRLSIQDVSVNGAQPMHSSSGRWVIVFNGEIYNHYNLRTQLALNGQSPEWVGTSDTETLLACIEAWGLNRTLRECRGMFALAVYDRKQKYLMLARDRMGEKPLYYVNYKQGFAVVSELVALKHLPRLKFEIDKTAVKNYVAYGYVPDNQCVLKDVRKVRPGTIVTVNVNQGNTNEETWFSYEDMVLNSRGSDVEIPEQFIAKSVEADLQEAVELQMLSDVPLGCFLSGGIDSTIVTALAQKVSRTPIRTFSMGFEEKNYNEAAFAAKIADHLGTNHTEFTVTEADAIDIVPELGGVYDEPFADSSHIPTLMVSRLAKSSVTVALTGDGGDEVFGGYNRHFRAPAIWNLYSKSPGFFRRRIGNFSNYIQNRVTSEHGFSRAVSKLFGLSVGNFDKLAKVGASLTHSESYEQFYNCLCQVSPINSDILVRDLKSSRKIDLQLNELTKSEWTMVADALGYLPGDVLVKVDRAAMSTSLETRSPFLDVNVMSTAWKVPLSGKVSNGAGKLVLKDILSKYIPEELFVRPKQGFSVPIDNWLRSELRDWAEETLRLRSLEKFDIDIGVFSDVWNDHLTGKVSNGAMIWTILMFEEWLKENPEFS